nr:OmpA family protein [uncultured Carboxylicivirga sp.]
MKKNLWLFLLILNQYVSAQCPEGSITSEQNLVINGDFENNVIEFVSDYIASRLAGAGNYTITDNAIKFSSTYFQGKGQGRFMAVDGAEGADKTVWKQNIKVKPNTNYFFSCWVNTLNIRTGLPAVLQFSINDGLLDQPFHCPDRLHVWKQFSVVWSSGNEEEIAIRIVSQNTEYDGNDFGLDRIKFYECEEMQMKIEEKIPIVLRNVFFETNSSVVLESSYAELDQLVNYLSENSSKNIAISGHTDSSGNKESNQKLSENRAQAVFNYIIEHGINSHRVSYVGYGQLKPVDTNETIEGRQKNRRVEFVIE